MSAYYNEIDPFAAQWLRNLIKNGSIAPGEVDERDIRDVTPNDLRGFTQCHFFAGIGVWSYALRLAGWPDDRPVWTGSCPCQPFSAAGKGLGFVDERHLWPAWFWLIGECSPGTIFGEQVSGKDGRTWLDLVSNDLEANGYNFGALDIPAASVGAPHKRNRHFFVAHSAREQARWESATGLQSKFGGCGNACELGHPSRERLSDELSRSQRTQWASESPGSDASSELGDSSRRGLEISGSDTCSRLQSDETNTAGNLAHADGGDSRSKREQCGGEQRLFPGSSYLEFWDDAIYINCTDGKARPTQPSIFPLAHGAPARVGRLRGYGNAINGPLAAAFIESAMEAIA